MRKLIYFPPGEQIPQVVYATEGGLYVRVCPDAELAAEGFGKFVESRYLQGYSETLWLAIEKYLEHRQQALGHIQATYSKLREGQAKLL